MVGVLASGNAIMPPAIPIATYRLQLTARFDFDAAAAIVPYLKALGITHLYASPFMKARAGSTHGYDIVDHTQLNPELGGAAGFERLTQALQTHGLGLILDFVPNHAGVHFADNPWWLDVLEWGPASQHAMSFDIDWELLPYRARGGVLLPILGTSYGQALENAEIDLRYDAREGSFSAWYFEHRLPIARESAYLNLLRALRDYATPIARKRRPSRLSCKASPAARTLSRAACRLIAQGLIAPRKCSHCIICWNASITSSGIGDWPPATSITGASSTSTRSPEYASRMPEPSTPSISSSKD
jgi:maltooligosyltrehalose synthase